MALAEIQSYKRIGKHLRGERVRRGLALAAIAKTSGLTISELVRIENGEFLGFKQSPEDALVRAELYAKALGIELAASGGGSGGGLKIANTEERYIPVFLRKNNN